MAAVASIVEGHGEVEAVPVLIRRVAGVVAPGLCLRVPRPIRVKRDEVLRPEKLGRAVELAARQAGRNGAIFLLIDADDDCPRPERRPPREFLRQVLQRAGADSVRTGTRPPRVIEPGAADRP